MTEALPAIEPDVFDGFSTVLGAGGENNEEGAVPCCFRPPISYVQRASDGGEPQFLARLRKLAHWPVACTRQPGPPLHPQPRHLPEICMIGREICSGTGQTATDAAKNNPNIAPHLPLKMLPQSQQPSLHFVIRERNGSDFRIPSVSGDLII